MDTPSPQVLPQVKNSWHRDYSERAMKLPTKHSVQLHGGMPVLLTCVQTIAESTKKCSCCLRSIMRKLEMASLGWRAKNSKLLWYSKNFGITVTNLSWFAQDCPWMVGGYFGIRNNRLILVNLFISILIFKWE